MTYLTYTLDISPDAEALTVRAATLFVEHSKAAIAKRGRFAVALSGGSTPRVLFEMLASPRFRDQVDWNHVFFFWGDERSVPPDHKDSNFRMAREAMLSPLNILESNIFRMLTEKPAAEAASLYRGTLAGFFAGEDWPRMDLLYLGMGDDGHTASLFPGTTALDVRDRSVTENFVPKFNTDRVTMTVPAINAARQIAFLVSGANKAEMLVNVLEGPYQPHELPSQLIQATDGVLTWLLDAPAAAKLTRK